MEINNLVKFSVDKKHFSTIAKKVLLGENKKKEKFSLAFVSKEEIRKLNKKFRRKNKPTDVLSFELKQAKELPNFLGEIVICPEVVKENAKKYGVSARYEMKKIFIHGILHLLGYDHEKSKRAEKEMEQKQENYLLKIK